MKMHNILLNFLFICNGIMIRGLEHPELPTHPLSQTTILPEVMKVSVKSVESISMHQPLLPQTVRHEHHTVSSNGGFFSDVRASLPSALANYLVQYGIQASVVVCITVVNWAREKMNSPEIKAREAHEETLMREHSLSQIKCQYHSEANALMERIQKLRLLCNNESDPITRLLLNAQLRKLNEELEQMSGPIHLTRDEANELKALQSAELK